MMLRYTAPEDSDKVAWAVAQMIPHARGRGFGACTAIGVMEDGKLIAGIVYHNWDPVAGTIEISGAALPKARWLTRETIRLMYSYPFEEIQPPIQMIIQRTPLDQQSLLRQLAAGGYELIRVPRLFGRDRDGVLCLLTRETWEQSRFIRPKPAVVEEAA